MLLQTFVHVSWYINVQEFLSRVCVYVGVEFLVTKYNHICMHSVMSDIFKVAAPTCIPSTNEWELLYNLVPLGAFNYSNFCSSGDYKIRYGCGVLICIFSWWLNVTTGRKTRAVREVGGEKEGEGKASY